MKKSNRCRPVLIRSLLIGMSIFVLSVTGFAQKRAGGKTVVTVNTEMVTNMEYETFFQDQLVENGSIQNVSKTNLQLSSPVFSNNHLRCSLGGYYTYHHANFNSSNILDTNYRIDMGTNHHLMGLSVIAIYMNQLFKRPLTILTNVRTECYEQGFGSVTGFLVGMLQLKQTSQSSFGVGLIGLINTTSPFPLFPMFTYRHRLDEKCFMEIMPPQFHFSYSFDSDNRLTAGISMDGDRFYIKPNNTSLPETCLYSRSLMRPELKYETSLSKELKLCFRHGGYHVINSKLYRKNSHSELIDMDTSTGAYWTVQLVANIF